MHITVIGTVNQDYTTAWHYAAAFEQLGLGVERVPTDRSWTGIEVDGLYSELRVGRVAEISVRVGIDDHVFSDDGDWAADPGPLPRDRVHWLRSGTHGPEAHDSEAYPPWVPQWDVAFVGSAPGAHPEWAAQRAALVEHLREWFGERFLHFGPGGVGLTDDSQNYHTEIRGHWLNRLYRSVPIVVGDSTLVDRDGRYWSDRCYETWGRGGFLIHPGVTALQMEIGRYPGSRWDVGDWDALGAEIDYWLTHPAEREEERRVMQERIRTRCTYADRARELLDMLGLTE